MLQNSIKDEAKNAILAVIEKIAEIMNSSFIDPKEQLERLKEQVDSLELLDKNDIDADMKAHIE